jgi:SsrA-binding protein
MKVISKNKRGLRNYLIIETYQAGISLLGQEIKSIKNFDVSLDGSFIKVDGNNVF